MSHYRKREPVITSTALDPLFDYDYDHDESSLIDDDDDYNQHQNLPSAAQHKSSRTMRSPLSSPPSSPESLLADEASSMSTLTPPMPIGVPASAHSSTASRHSQSTSPPFSPPSPRSSRSSFSSSTSSSLSSSSASSGASDPRARTSVWHMLETHQLASKARRKLVAEASRSEHKLRLLVGHANFLDACMFDIQAFDEEAVVFDEDDARPPSRERDVGGERGRSRQRRAGKRRPNPK